MFVSYSKISDSSRIWIYQSNRFLTDQEVISIKKKLLNFCIHWKSHQKNLVSSYNLLYNQFIILLVDELQLKASGCSIDSSVAFIKSIELDYNIDLFNRTNIAYEKNGKILIKSLVEFKKIVNENTIFFNNLVEDKKGLQNNWRIKAKDSWLSKYLP